MGEFRRIVWCISKFCGDVSRSAKLRPGSCTGSLLYWRLTVDGDLMGGGWMEGHGRGQWSAGSGG